MRGFLRRLFCRHEWSHPTHTGTLLWPTFTTTNGWRWCLRCCVKCDAVERIGGTIPTTTTRDTR